MSLSGAGYFTSRPAAKAYIRSSSAYLQAARQLEVLHAVVPVRVLTPASHACTQGIFCLDAVVRGCLERRMILGCIERKGITAMFRRRERHAYSPLWR